MRTCEFCAIISVNKPEHRLICEMGLKPLSQLRMIPYDSKQMSMKMLLSTGSITTLLLGNFCPMRMAAAMSMPEPMQHLEMMEVAMTPMVPMTLAVPLSMPLAPHVPYTMSVPPSGNCTAGHCVMMNHSNQQIASVSTFAVQLVSSAALPVPQPPVSASSGALPPDVGKIHLAQTLSTVVLRV